MICTYITSGWAWTTDHATVLAAVVGTIATVAIAGFTYTLKRSTDKLWNISREQAKISERSLTELERPYLFIEIVKSGLGFGADSHGITDKKRLEFGDLVFRVVNHGRTPAQLIHLKREVRLVQVAKSSPRRITLPPPIDPSKETDWNFPVGSVIPHEEAREFEYPLMAGLSDVQQIKDMFEAQVDMFFLGYVRYRDIFNIYHIIGFCWFLHRTRNEFLLAGGENYNYSKTEGTSPHLPIVPDADGTGELPR